MEPEKFEFASAVTGGTLVSLIQNGLFYDGMLSDIEGRPKKYAFIDQPYQKPAQQQPRAVEKPTVRKPSRAEINGHPPIVVEGEAVPDRTASSVLERPDLPAPPTDDVMDVDDDVNDIVENGRAASAESIVKTDGEEELVSVPTTLETGKSIGVQSEIRHEHLTPRLVINTAIPGSDVVHLTWHPKVSDDLLATGGSVWRRWTLATTAGDGSSEMQCTDYGAEESKGKPFYIDAVSWSPSGEHLALVMETENALSSKCGTVLRLLNNECQGWEIARDAGTVLSLRWNSDSSLLLVTSVGLEQVGKITVWDVQNGCLRAAFPTAKAALDAAWISDTSVITCGEGFIRGIDVANANNPVKSVETDLAWDKVLYDGLSNKAAFLSPEGRELGVWDLETLNFKHQVVHDGAITSFTLQPAGSIDGRASSRFLATACVDGSVKLWNIRTGAAQCVETFTMVAGVPAMAVAFSSSGDLLAAAGGDVIFVWEARVNGKVHAKWQAPATHVNGDAMDTDHDFLTADEDDGIEGPFFTLSWNADGSKLAYGRDDNKVRQEKDTHACAHVLIRVLGICDKYCWLSEAQSSLSISRRGLPRD